MALRPKHLPRFDPMFGSCQHVPAYVRNLPAGRKCRVCDKGPREGSKLVCMDCHRVSRTYARQVEADYEGPPCPAAKAKAAAPVHSQAPKEASRPLTRREKREILYGMRGNARRAAETWLSQIPTDESAKADHVHS